MFTPDGKYLLAGNYLTQDFSILRVNGSKVTDTGKRFKVPGHPASGRMSHRGCAQQPRRIRQASLARARIAAWLRGARADVWRYDRSGPQL